MIRFFEDITMQMVESDHQKMATKMVLLGMTYHLFYKLSDFDNALQIVHKQFALWREWQQLVG